MEKLKSMTLKPKLYSGPSKAIPVGYLLLPLLMDFFLPDPETPKLSAMMSDPLITLLSSFKDIEAKYVALNMMLVDWLPEVMITLL